MLQHTNEVVTVTEVAETVVMKESAADKVQHKQIPKRRMRWFESDFFSTTNREVKQANKYGEQ